MVRRNDGFQGSADAQDGGRVDRVLLKETFERLSETSEIRVRPGKGPIDACDTLKNWLKRVRFRPGDWYIGKMDIQKFFFRVPVDVQLRELGKPLDDVRMLWFLETMIRSDGRPFGMPLEVKDPLDVEMVSGIGMQVGSLISHPRSSALSIYDLPAKPKAKSRPGAITS